MADEPEKTKNDLLYAILAMDSYNRSYGQRIAGLISPEFDAEGNPLTIVRIGNALIAKDSSVLLNGSGARKDVEADFYAIAYDWNGETVISYRGTDNLLADAATGYGVGAGIACVMGVGA